MLEFCHENNTVFMETLTRNKKGSTRVTRREDNNVEDEIKYKIEEFHPYFIRNRINILDRTVDSLHSINLKSLENMNLF